MMDFNQLALGWHNILFYLNVVLLLVILWKWHNCEDTSFDFRTALVDPDTDRISFGRLGHFVSLFISTMILCYETVNGRLTEWLFTGYMLAWAGTYVAAKALNKQNPKEE